MKWTERPVFHDGTGRRRRWMTLLFASVGTALVLALGTIGLALTGNSPVHLPGFPNPSPNANPTEIQPGPGLAPTPADGSARTIATVPGNGQTNTANPATAPSETHGRKPTDTPSHPKPSRT
jgi:hypothetical protein